MSDFLALDGHRYTPMSAERHQPYFLIFTGRIFPAINASQPCLSANSLYFNKLQ
jgi:hypothetical protein